MAKRDGNCNRMPNSRGFSLIFLLRISTGCSGVGGVDKKKEGNQTQMRQILVDSCEE